MVSPTNVMNIMIFRKKLFGFPLMISIYELHVCSDYIDELMLILIKSP